MIKERRISTWIVTFLIIVLVVFALLAFFDAGDYFTFGYIALLVGLTLIRNKMVSEDEAWMRMERIGLNWRYQKEQEWQQSMAEAKRKSPELFQAWSENEKRAREHLAPEPVKFTNPNTRQPA